MDNYKIGVGSHFVKHPGDEGAGNDIPLPVPLPCLIGLQFGGLLETGNGSCYSM